MPQNFLTCDRDQSMLLPPDLRDWLPEDHLAWFVIEAIEELDLEPFYAAYRSDGHGAAAHEPKMMLTLAELLARRDTPRVMSQENVDLVQRLYETGLFDQDPAEWLPGLATPDIEYVNPPYAVEPGVRRGPENVVAAMRRFAEVWRGSRHELHELFDGGDVVVAAVSWCTLTRGSETEIVQEEVHTWTIREGRIARWEWGLDVSSALRAAGLDR